MKQGTVLPAHTPGGPSALPTVFLCEKLPYMIFHTDIHMHKEIISDPKLKKQYKIKIYQKQESNRKYGYTG
jgi:hypothetical protein